jgi:predicted nucleic acid-binding protein
MVHGVVAIGRMMAGEYEALVDSDAWVGLFSPKDAHHQEVSKIFNKLKNTKMSIVTTSAVEGETATVLSHEVGQHVAGDFVASLATIQVPIIHIDEELHDRAIEWFIDQNRRGTSYVDCTNIAVMERYDIPKILSFDQFYFKDFGLKSV